MQLTGLSPLHPALRSVGALPAPPPPPHTGPSEFWAGRRTSEEAPCPGETPASSLLAQRLASPLLRCGPGPARPWQGNRAGLFCVLPGPRALGPHPVGGQRGETEEASGPLHTAHRELGLHFKGRKGVPVRRLQEPQQEQDQQGRGRGVQGGAVQAGPPPPQVAHSPGSPRAPAAASCRRCPPSHRRLSHL